MSPMPKNQKGISPILLIIGVILIAIIIFSIWYFFLKDKTEPKISEKQAQDVQEQLKDHPELFVADLEIDLQTKIVTQHQLTKTNGDIPIIQKDKPASSSAKFIYKVEVISKDGILKQSGWTTLSINISKTKKNTHLFSIYAPFYQDAIIRVYSEGEDILWTGKMK